MYLMRFDRVSLQKFDAFGAAETRGTNRRLSSEKEARKSGNFVNSVC